MRLKVYTEADKIANVAISIPTGAIKSRRIKEIQVLQIVISIPTGAIKRKTFTPFSSLILKISIPTGAIKRCDRKKTSEEKMEFQFLLVRLKELGN